MHYIFQFFFVHPVLKWRGYEYGFETIDKCIVIYELNLSLDNRLKYYIKKKLPPDYDLSKLSENLIGELIISTYKLAVKEIFYPNESECQFIKKYVSVCMFDIDNAMLQFSICILSNIMPKHLLYYAPKILN